jgi:hypothetical protein
VSVCASVSLPMFELFFACATLFLPADAFVSFSPSLFVTRLFSFLLFDA